MTWNDVFLGGTDADIFVYDPTGRLLGQLRSGAATLNTHGMRVSGDCFRVIASSNQAVDQAVLSFQTIPGQ